MFLGLFISSFLSKIIHSRKTFYPAFCVILAVCVLMACFLPICPTHKNGLAILVTGNLWKLTDDGPRSFWGYCLTLKHFSIRQYPEEIEKYENNPESLLLIGPYDGWLSGSQSQPYVLFIIQNCKKIEAERKYLIGESNGKKIVLTNPSDFSENLEKHFVSAGVTPIQIMVRLQLSNIEDQVLKIISKGETTINHLVEELKSDKDTVSEVINALRMRGLITLTDDNRLRSTIETYLDNTTIDDLKENE